MADVGRRGRLDRGVFGLHLGDLSVDCLELVVGDELSDLADGLDEGLLQKVDRSLDTDDRDCR